MNRFVKNGLKGALVLSMVVPTLSNGVAFAVSNNGSTSREAYQNYNKERSEKLTLQSIAEKYELNAILMVTEVRQWDAFGNDTSGKSNSTVKLGKFKNLDDLFVRLKDDRKKHEDYYKKYKENSTKPIEQQKDMKAPSNLDFLSISSVKINYYYDSSSRQLSQVIRIESPDRVFRCTVIYDSNGSVINYLEV